MNAILFIVLSIVLFLCSLIGYNRFRITTLYALAIGGAVNANFYHAYSYPVVILGLPFGVDSIIYTLFVFCILVMLLKDGKKAAYNLAISSLVAIVISAIIDLISHLLSNGYSTEIIYTFLRFIFSVIASLVALAVVIELITKLRKKMNNYLLLIIGIFVASIINTAIYFPLSGIVATIPTNVSILIFTSFLGKMVSIAVGLLTYYFMNLIEKRKLNS